MQVREFPFNETIILEDDRVLLRPLKADDFNALLKYVQNEPELFRFALTPMLTEEDLKKYISHAFFQHKEKQTGIFKESAWKKYNNTFLKAYASRLRIYSVGYNFIQSYDLFTAWLMQGNYVYFSGLVFPSIVFKRKLKNPLRFNLLERIALNFFTWRYTKFQASRESQGRISKTAPNTLRYSDVRVPKNFRFYFVPFHLLLKSLKAYLKLEVKEIKKA